MYLNFCSIVKSFLYIPYDTIVFKNLLIFKSITNPHFLDPSFFSVIHLNIICIILSGDNVLFINITTSHLSNVIPNDNIVPANKINPSFPSSVDSISFSFI